MLVMNFNEDYNDSLSINNNCTNNEINFDIIIPTLLLTKPCGLYFLCLMSLMVYTLNKPFFQNEFMENIFYPNHPVRCIITGPSKSAKSVFLTDLILNNINECDNIYI